jgi:hypothetical protein
MYKGRMVAICAVAFVGIFVSTMVGYTLSVFINATGRFEPPSDISSSVPACQLPVARVRA